MTENSRDIVDLDSWRVNGVRLRQEQVRKRMKGKRKELKEGKIRHVRRANDMMGISVESPKGSGT